MTRCSAAWGAPASCSPMNGRGVPPDIMAIAKALGGGFPVGACLATERAAVGHGRRYPRLDLRRQPAGDGGRQRRPRRDAGTGFLRTRRRDGKAAARTARSAGPSYPRLFAELRGSGLLLGIRCVVPAADFVAKLRQNWPVDFNGRRKRAAHSAAADRRRARDRRGARDDAQGGSRSGRHEKRSPANWRRSIQREAVPHESATPFPRPRPARQRRTAPASLTWASPTRTAGATGR